MLHSDPLEQTAISLWAFPLLKMSKPTKQRATTGDKYCFCFTHLNLRFPLTLRRVCSPFFSFQTLWRWIAATTAKWENDYIDRKKDQNQSGSGSFSAVPEEPGNFLVSLPRWLEAQPTFAVGSSWIREGVVAEDDGWDIGQDERAESWWVGVRQFKCKHHSYEPSICGVSIIYNPLQTVTQSFQLLPASDMPVWSLSLKKRVEFCITFFVFTAEKCMSRGCCCAFMWL